MNQEPDQPNKLLHQVVKTLTRLARDKDPLLTPEELARVYAVKEDGFGLAPLKHTDDKKRPELDLAETDIWRLVLFAANPVDTEKKLEKAITRLAAVVRGLRLADISDLYLPVDLPTSTTWIREVLKRLRDRLTALSEEKQAKEQKDVAPDPGVVAKVSRPVPSDAATPAPTDEAQTQDELIKALNLVFGFGDHDVQPSRLPSEKYFGYRRSANSGEIVRFFVELKREPSGMLRFDNYFRRFPTPWIVDGRGFSIGEITYLLGSAKSSPTSRTGKGIRFFTLQPYEFRWLVGLLDTRDNKGQPISARVVLVPVDCHDYGSTLTCDRTNREFISYIAEPVDPYDLDTEISVDPTDDHLLMGLSTGNLIQSLIWNGSLRALHGEPQPIPRTQDHHGLENLIKLQNRVLALEKQPENDVQFFMRLLGTDSVYKAIDKYLKKLESKLRRHKPKG